MLSLAEGTGKLTDFADSVELVADDCQDAVLKRTLMVELARLSTDRLEDASRGQRAWKRALELEPRDEEAFDALDRIYRAEGRYAELRELLRQRIDQTFDDVQRRDLYLAVSELSEGVLEDTSAAIDAYIHVLEIDPMVSRAYKALGRLYREAERWDDLDELLARELDYTETRDSQLTLLLERARLKADKLGDRRSAVDLAEEVLNRYRGSDDARELLEEALSDPDLRVRVARILEPLYQDDELWRDLVVVLRAQLEDTGSTEESAELLARIASIEEEKLEHSRAAFDSWRQVLEISPAEERARQHVVRLAAINDIWAEAATALEASTKAIDDGDLAGRAGVLRDLATIQERHLGTLSAAIETREQLLDVELGSVDSARGTASALARLYDQEQRWDDLVSLRRRELEWVDSPDARRDLFIEIANLQEQRLEDVVSAIATWRELFVEEPEDAAALDALERLYIARDETPELIEVVRRRSELANDDSERKRQLWRIADLQENKLNDPVEAVSVYLEVLDTSPDDRATLRELARLYRTQERHGDLLEIVERRMTLAADATERLELLFEMAELLCQHLHREPEALGSLRRGRRSRP